MVQELTEYENEMINSLEIIMKSSLFTGEERINSIKDTLKKIKNNQN